MKNNWQLLKLFFGVFQSINLPRLGSRLVKTISERQDLEDELILITEFNKMELQMVVNFCMEGILPLPISQLEKNVPIQISRFVSYVKRLNMGKNSFIIIILDLIQQTEVAKKFLKLRSFLFQTQQNP